MKTAKNVRAPKPAVSVAWTSGSVPKPGPGAAARPTISLNRAREELGLSFADFELALQLGEIRTVACGGGQWRVGAAELARVRGREGHPQVLLDRLRLVTSGEAAELIGISRDRLVRLTRAGLIRPVRWYVNRYRALVWLYLAHELRSFADESPALLRGRLPAGLRESLDEGEDQRARGWRARRVAQLVRDAHDPWEEAAVWAALLGPEAVGDAVPDPYERARLCRIREALPPGRPGPLAGPELVRSITTADHPDEITLALFALDAALHRARAEHPAPRPALTIPAGPRSDPRPDPRPEARPEPGPGLRPPRPDPRPDRSSAAGPADLVAAPAPPPRSPHPSASPRVSPPPPRPGTRSRQRMGLLGRLRGRRRSAVDPAEQPFLHHGHEQPPPPVEDLSPRQAAGAGRDG